MTKRKATTINAIVGNVIVYHHYTIFKWCMCCKCDTEFRKEFGWSFIVGPYYGGIGQYKYLCKDCAPTMNYAMKYACSGEWKLAKPTLPPKPQCREVNELAY